MRQRLAFAARALVALVTVALAPADAAAQTATLAGTVSDAATGQPLAGVAVLVYAQTTLRGDATGLDGRYRIEAIAPGAARVVVRALGFATVDTTLALAGDVRLDVRLAPEAVAGAEVVVQARRTLTATRADAPVLLVPQAVAVLPAALLQAQGARTAADALRNVPGATTRARGEPAAVPVLRGFETDYTGGGVRRDGVEVPYLFDGLQANVERVEVLRGPASVLYGRLEPGGVVNFVTKRPGGRVRAAEAEGATTGAARVAVDVGRDVGAAAAVRLNASAARTATGRDHVTGAVGFVAPALRWRPRAGLTLDASAEATLAETVLDPGLAESAPDPRGLLPGPPAPVTRFFGEPDARHRWRALALATAADWGVSGTTAVRATLAASRSHLRRDALDLDSLTTLPDGALAAARSLRREGLGFTYLKATVFADARARTGAVDHALTVGAEALRAWAQADGHAPLTPTPGGLRFALVRPVSLADPAPTGLPADLERYLDATVRGIDLGAFVQDRLSLPMGRAGRLHAVVSARVTHVRYAAEIFALASTPEAPAGVSERDGHVTAFTPSVGVVAQGPDGWALYASAGTSFNPIVERVDRAGQPFAPTRGAQLEAGLKRDGARAGATLAAFWLQKDDALTQAPDGFYDQTGRQRSRGVELDVRAAPRDGLSVQASYAYLDAAVVADDHLAPGSRLPYAPRHAASLWAEVRHGPATLRGGVWTQGARVGSSFSGARLPAATTVDVGAELALPRGAALRFDVRNAFGARDDASATVRPGGLAVRWPSSLREVRVGVRVGLGA